MLLECYIPHGATILNLNWVHHYKKNPNLKTFRHLKLSICCEIKCKRQNSKLWFTAVSSIMHILVHKMKEYNFATSLCGGDALRWWHNRKKGPCKAIHGIGPPALNYRLVWIVLLGITSSWGITLHVTICHLQRSKKRPIFLQKQKGHTSCQVLSMRVKVLLQARGSYTGSL